MYHSKANHAGAVYDFFDKRTIRPPFFANEKKLIFRNMLTVLTTNPLYKSYNFPLTGHY